MTLARHSRTLVEVDFCIARLLQNSVRIEEIDLFSN